MSVLEAAKRLRDAADAFEAGGKVAYAYNPLRYAWKPHETFVQRYGNGTRRVLLVGMNPGPWGMGQTGVPFGDVAIVRDWMRVTGNVDQPPRVHPKRPIHGFANKRSEPSGSRLYGWAEQRFRTADAFFREFYILNYCPLLFFDESGKNLTPPDLPKAQTQALHEACDRHVADVVRTMAPEFIVGVGKFARDQLAAIVDAQKLDVQVGMVLHPSPASPLANKGWAAQAEAQLKELGVL